METSVVNIKEWSVFPVFVQMVSAANLSAADCAGVALLKDLKASALPLLLAKTLIMNAILTPLHVEKMVFATDLAPVSSIPPTPFVRMPAVLILTIPRLQPFVMEREIVTQTVFRSQPVLQTKGAMSQLVCVTQTNAMTIAILAAMIIIFVTMTMAVSSNGQMDMSVQEKGTSPV
jgi:hypothetical protein